MQEVEEALFECLGEALFECPGSAECPGADAAHILHLQLYIQLASVCATCNDACTLHSCAFITLRSKNERIELKVGELNRLYVCLTCHIF